MPATRTWLITGASSGLGKGLALQALKAGQKVIGTTRDVSSAEGTCPEFSKNGGIWIGIDPAQKDAFDQFSKVAQQHDVDVLVNNAGYAFIGGMEDTSEDEVRAQMEVNFFGPLKVIKACLPTMRTKRAGEIVLMSSGAGFSARPARSTYSASKFAIEAVHESLLAELKTFNINVLIVEPGAFRTPFTARISTPAGYQATGGFSPAYKGTAVETMLTMSATIKDIKDFAKGDPDIAGEVIVKAVLGGHSYLRLPLGRDCIKANADKMSTLQSDFGMTKTLAESTDVD